MCGKERQPKKPHQLFQEKCLRKAGLSEEQLCTKSEHLPRSGVVWPTSPLPTRSWQHSVLLCAQRLESSFWTCVSPCVPCKQQLTLLLLLVVPDSRTPDTKPQPGPYCHRLEVAVLGNKVLQIMKNVSLSATHCQVTEVIHGSSAAAH